MKQLQAEEFGVSRETEEKLRTYLALLIRWNSRINLVAAAPEAALWQRHFLDSLQLLPLMPPDPTGPLVDLGSGAGFPGLVLAAATGLPTHLVESDRRKCAFLTEASRALGLAAVTAHPQRIEDTALPPVQLLTARALAPLAKLLPHAHRLLVPGGIALFPKGRNVDQELTEAARRWTMRIERFPSRTDSSATLLRLSEIRPASPAA
ncbi:16S rRNA (guanine(527)-N(7))-methyltransferase RsmG [Siccirubricoccus phaeus]|uniref:16S rRNA (guanine(527)-N(7))-methyltransferase RsmG n=1 Tax=Siccirubricoccus phaeus TaxID=2595053 RepID=UPI0011F32847|nr:16S rRNA (guanine(527)-N(7))-methyltransferase RsmG [Siccirubricoccus phaeus]